MAAATAGNVVCFASPNAVRCHAPVRPGDRLASEADLAGIVVDR